ncbi:unnamed protein product [Tuber aestivum]|uniref:Uncharacterized protein n=1 Tax=Tuber aestivum TaxID=59557 RepID=A0A292Q2E6_9PEZI|nr:unnamed protein product [Tuber aestivum]
MPPLTSTPALRMRSLHPHATRSISTTPHLLGGGPRPKKSRIVHRGKTLRIPKSSSVLSATSFRHRTSHHEVRKPADHGVAPPVIRKIIPKGPSRDLIHYIPPSNPLRSVLGPGMYYDTKLDMCRCTSTPVDKDVETEYMYTLMLRKTLSTSIVPTKYVTLRFAVNKCMEATGSHKKASATRLRKGFLSEAMGTILTKKKAWVCDYARANFFDWDLHESMRSIRGHLFTGKEVDYYTPEGQVLGAQSCEKRNSKAGRKEKFHKDMAILLGDNVATATAGPETAAAASATRATKIAGMAVTSDHSSDSSDSDGKILDDLVLEDSGSDTTFRVPKTSGKGKVSAPATRGRRWVSTDTETESDRKLRDDRVLEDSGSDADFEALMTTQSHDKDKGEDEGESDGGGRTRTEVIQLGSMSSAPALDTVKQYVLNGVPVNPIEVRITVTPVDQTHNRSTYISTHHILHCIHIVVTTPILSTHAQNSNMRLTHHDSPSHKYY